MFCYVFLTGLKWKFEVAMAKVNIWITSNKWEGWSSLKPWSSLVNHGLLKFFFFFLNGLLLFYYNKTMVNFRKGKLMLEIEFLCC